MSPLVIEGRLGGSGLTVAIKDTIDVAGWPTRCGSRALQHALPAPNNATVVQALLDGGWQVIGKTVLHELAFGVTGINEWAGTPVNPQAPERIPGGSSSGSAVIVAQGIADVALGTDTGGSVRMPAACCGVFGLKPTFGRLSREGVHPVSSSLDCVGPMARDLDTLVAAMSAMDSTFVAQTPGAQLHVGLVDVTCDPAIESAIREAITHRGWTWERVTLPLLDQAFEAALTVINAETWAAFGHFTGQGLLGADIEARLLRAAATDATALNAAESVRVAFSAQVDQLLSRFDTLVLPGLPRLPPLLADVQRGEPVLDLTRFLRPFNLSGHPALSVPVAYPDSTLSTSLQLIGRKGDDAQLCAMAGVSLNKPVDARHQ
ncbi:amidase [Rhodococcus sp. IEGM1300]